MDYSLLLPMKTGHHHRFYRETVLQFCGTGCSCADNPVTRITVLNICKIRIELPRKISPGGGKSSLGRNFAIASTLAAANQFSPLLLFLVEPAW